MERNGNNETLISVAATWEVHLKRDAQYHELFDALHRGVDPRHGVGEQDEAEEQQQGGARSAASRRHRVGHSSHVGYAIPRPIDHAHSPHCGILYSFHLNRALDHSPSLSLSGEQKHSRTLSNCPYSSRG